MPASYRSNISSGFDPFALSQNQDLPLLIVPLFAELCALNLIHSRALPSGRNNQSIVNSIKKFLRRLKRTPLSLGKFEFRWHKLTMKCLGKNGLSNAVHSLSPFRKSGFNSVSQCE